MPKKARHRRHCIDRLTSRQWEVGTLVSKGLTNKEVALALGLSESTIKEHLKALFEKLGIQRRGGLCDAMNRYRAPQ